MSVYVCDNVNTLVIDMRAVNNVGVCMLQCQHLSYNVNTGPLTVRHVDGWMRGFDDTEPRKWSELQCWKRWTGRTLSHKTCRCPSSRISALINRHYGWMTDSVNLVGARCGRT